LVTYYKYDVNAFNKKYGDRDTKTNNTNPDEDENLRKNLAAKDKQIEQLEKAIKDLKASKPSSEKTGSDHHKHALESNYQQLKEAYQDLDAKHKALIASKDDKKHAAIIVDEDIANDSHGKKNEENQNNSKIKKSKKNHNR